MQYIQPKRSKYKKTTKNYVQDNILDIIDIEETLLKNRYIDKFGLLSREYSPQEILIRSTDVNRTIESVECFIQGLYPKGTGPVLKSSIASNKNITYDYPAGYPKTKSEREYEKAQKFKCHDLTNGILEGKCVCDGYACILQTALQLVGLDAHYVDRPNPR